MNLNEWKEKCSAVAAEYVDIISKTTTLEALETARVASLGRKGVLTELLKNLKDFSIEEKKVAGPLGNDLKKTLESAFDAKEAELASAKLNEELNKTNIDLTLPGTPVTGGHSHPLTIALERMTTVLSKLGFVWTEGPQIEEEKYNFDFLNIPQNHPARDVQDTLFIANSAKKGMVLRTHTSNVQVRYMEKNKPPLRIMSPGRVFRKDDIDASHSPVFHQIEGLYVDKNVTMADLKSDLTAFMKGLFGNKAEVKFRPSFFPFTEPSVEVDVKCVLCDGNSPCAFCKGTGWKEMLGAGMVHPNVLRNVGIDPEVYSGYAFGMGVERLAMLMLNIKDIRAFYENDLRILKQF
ncbi:phenylalanyl-tRNA synthetase alpha chain [Elusimicrobium simillimum]|uniref:phenylalanine--tRNA ligase subunit alpha n=1 Tax=Elusimicrobium simillimum TaxID=3143438 RepID=UPI003C6F81AE